MQAEIPSARKAWERKKLEREEAHTAQLERVAERAADASLMEDFGKRADGRAYFDALQTELEAAERVLLEAEDDDSASDRRRNLLRGEVRGIRRAISLPAQIRARAERQSGAINDA